MGRQSVKQHNLNNFVVSTFFSRYNADCTYTKTLIQFVAAKLDNGEIKPKLFRVVTVYLEVYSADSMPVTLRSIIVLFPQLSKCCV